MGATKFNESAQLSDVPAVYFILEEKNNHNCVFSWMFGIDI